MPWAEFRGHPLFYAEYPARAGPPARPPLVLVHGAGGTHLHWPPHVRRWRGTDVYALDLPGHGQSGGGPCRSIAEKAQAVLALLDHLGLPSAVLAGHSMGGAIVQTLALDQPQRAAGLVLVGTGARLKVSPAIMERLAQDFAGAVGYIIEGMFGPTAPENVKRLAQQRMLQMDPQVLLGDWEACNGFDVRERLDRLIVPALIVAGTADRMTPEKLARELAERLPRARLEFIPGAGHMVMLEQPEAVAQAIGDFVAQVAAA